MAGEGAVPMPGEGAPKVTAAVPVFLNGKPTPDEGFVAAAMFDTLPPTREAFAAWLP